MTPKSHVFDHFAGAGKMVALAKSPRVKSATITAPASPR
jgi:hypothetical protein